MNYEYGMTNEQIGEVVNDKLNNAESLMKMAMVELYAGNKEQYFNYRQQAETLIKEANNLVSTL